MANVGSKKVQLARCLSPIPKRSLTRGRRSAMKCSPALHLRPRTVSRRFKKTTVVETLNKIEESCELNTTYISKVKEQSFQLCVVENADEADKNTVHQSCREENFSERNESPPGSSEGMTLPTGVSSFLLDCLDSLPVSETTEPVNSDINSCLSPEEFRGAEECSDLKRTIKSHAVDWLTYKNSTLLDSSKALNIDLVAQITNLSAILEPSSKDNRAEKRLREQLKGESSSTAQHVSTIVAGKKVCKLVSAREKTPKHSKSVCPVFERPVSKDILKSKYIKCKKKVDFSNCLDNEMPSCDVRRSKMEMSNNSTGVTAEGLQVRTSEPEKMDLSPVCMSSLEDELMVNTTGPFVCSSEIVPAHLSTDEFTRYQTLFKTLEICSVIRAPESHDPQCSAERFPVDENVLALMKKLPIDDIIRFEDQKQIFPVNQIAQEEKKTTL
ncbi:meiosis-specific kinetochore protein isoform X2 [Microcaecilia unicolor]|uniref:Meiosis-specific kinetochore protein isoform X2 n=1 Tax=Microcaecilia unicolor TaxID=1415580 RepID=A0A6P7YZJ6_9AMPH|nr:meiosis-specific kinetochore protein isoform X2 [Microcaecilia unicolor]